MVTVTNEWLRPSALPKLAKCAQYRSEAVAGPAADRGTKLDVAFRAILAGETVDLGTLDADEQVVVCWAVETAKALSGGHPLESREENLRAAALGLSGTADLLCSAALWSADLKTGQKRGYVEQQAVYALGFMDDCFVDEWTVYLLYCDQQEVETLRYTREEATQIVRAVLAKVADPEERPTLNEYCGWCAQRFTCPVRKEALGNVSFDGPDGLALENASSILLRDFVLRAGVVEEYAEKARAILKERCIGGEKIPGVSLTSKRGTQKVPARVVELHWKELGTADLLAMYGDASAAKLREIWARKLPTTPFPEDQVQEMPGSSYVRVSRPKGEKA